MRVTILQHSQRGMRSIKLKDHYLYLVGFVLLAVTTALLMLGYYFGQSHALDQQMNQQALGLSRVESSDQNQLHNPEEISQQQLAALAARVGMLQAHISRLDAAGERIVTIAGLDAKEFNFQQKPAVGGPQNLINGKSLSIPLITASLEEIDQQRVSREDQLEVLESVLMDLHMGAERYVSGRPINKGWMSSDYGVRKDPFTGKDAWHAGVDFAGKEGTDVIATAAGVISWVGDRYGYGLLVEINHGNGLVTRYAHNKENLVKKGQVVRKGQVIALLGNTGRSTGPHLHYEVLKNGRHIDPKPYIYRKLKVAKTTR